jgi:outer membrane protein assembly factor BamB
MIGGIGSALDQLANVQSNALVVTAARTFIVQDTAVLAVDRSTRATLWSRAAVYPDALIVAGADLFAGGPNEVARFRCSDGVKTWSAKVEGRAAGLAAANGVLYVSTDTGLLYAFAAVPPQGQTGLRLY